MPGGVEALELLYRLEAKTRTLGRRAQGQLAGEGHHLVEGHAGVGDLAPPDLDAPASRGRNVTVSLGRIEGVAAMAGELGGLRGELMTVERAEQVFAAGGGQHPKFPGRPAIHRQLENVRAFEQALDAALECQLLEVRRGVEGNPAFAVQLVIDGHDPAFARAVPEQARVAAFVPDDGVAAELRPGASAVVAERNAFPATRAGVG